MHSLKVYQYRSLLKAKGDVSELHESMSEEERSIVFNDSGYEMILMDVDVSAEPDLPVRVWQRVEPECFLTKLVLWTDADVSAFQLAQSLGILGPKDTLISRKAMFWSDNVLGVLLYKMLMAMTAAGVLEFREDPDLQFRAKMKGEGNSAKTDNREVFNKEI